MPTEDRLTMIEGLGVEHFDLNVIPGVIRDSWE